MFDGENLIFGREETTMHESRYLPRREELLLHSC